MRHETAAGDLALRRVTTQDMRARVPITSNMVAIALPTATDGLRVESGFQTA
jgi:hypothetical protein